ncbi:CTP synthase 1 [Sparganum proliferum]
MSALERASSRATSVVLGSGRLLLGLSKGERPSQAARVYLLIPSSSSPPPPRYPNDQTGRVSPLTLAAWNGRSSLDNPRSNRPEPRTTPVARELTRSKSGQILDLQRISHHLTDEPDSTMKYLLVTGGVISGIGKGIVSSSIGAIMKANGWVVTCIKIDPYLNIDAGTFSPYEHGEVYVLDDGSEVDLDLGNYERFLDVTLTKEHNITTGKIYQQVTQRERKGEYLGKTVQVVPHITDAIQEWVIRVAQKPVDSSGKTPELCMIELGGTIGDIESMPFVEAFRQLQYRVGPKNFCCVHVSLVPNLSSVGEPKTKPTQISIRELRSRGLQADLLMCRCNCSLPPNVMEKLGLFCQVPIDHVIMVQDVDILYEVPMRLEEQGLSNLLLRHFDLHPKSLGPEPPLASWHAMVDQIKHANRTIRIAVAGKYTKLSDAYLSLIKACEHAATYINCKAKVDLVNTEDLETPVAESAPDQYHVAWLAINNADAVIVAGGFGIRGCEGKVAVIRYCRERGIPFLGICLGFQLAVVEFARNVLGWTDANSTEFDPHTSHPCVIDMPEFNPGDMGGTMRLGSRRTNFFLSADVRKYLKSRYPSSTKACMEKPIADAGDVDSEDVKRSDQEELKYFNIYKLVNADHIYARHRHRYEVNPEKIHEFESHGFAFIGRDAAEGNRMEIGELINPVQESVPPSRVSGVLSNGSSGIVPSTRHPYFVGTQFHPEYTSRPMRPSPFFLGLLLAASSNLDKYLDQLSINDFGSGNLPPPMNRYVHRSAASYSYNTLFPEVGLVTPSSLPKA